MEHYNTKLLDRKYNNDDTVHNWLTTDLLFSLSVIFNTDDLHDCYFILQMSDYISLI